jgi:hypothetical protein
LRHFLSACFRPAVEVTSRVDDLHRTFGDGRVEAAEPGLGDSQRKPHDHDLV